jgi:hypothetical protein
MLDSPEGACPGQARFEYPATSVLFSMCSHGRDSSSLKQAYCALKFARLGLSLGLSVRGGWCAGGPEAMMCRMVLSG